MLPFFRNIHDSFPVQLLLLHLRANLILLVLWGYLVLAITGNIGSIFGIKYLYLSPEYMHEVDFLSFALVGLGYGSFVMAWHMSTYLLLSYRFPFLASLDRPFAKYCLNNSILPVAFLGLYMGCSVYFQVSHELRSLGEVYLNLLGLLYGIAVIFILTFLYFAFRNHDIGVFLKKTSAAILKEVEDTPLANKIEKEVLDQNRKRAEMAEEATQVRFYLTEGLALRYVRDVRHYPQELLLRVFRQHHFNALLFQVLTLLLLALLGLLMEVPQVQIPAAASSLFLLTMFAMLLGGLMYWLHRWQVTALFIFFIALNFVSSFDILKNTENVYGLDYTKPPLPYSYEALGRVSSRLHQAEDYNRHLAALDNWRDLQPTDDTQKPKLVIFNASGGGMRAAIWAMQVLRTADSLADGRLHRRMALISGASGGMLGAAYYRELAHLHELGERTDLYAERHLEDMATDLLNPLIFSIVVNDLFVRWQSFEQGGLTYRKDRAYIFEQEFDRHTRGLLDKPLVSYAELEQSGRMPTLVLSPSVVNDGRRLLLTAQPMTHLTIAPIGADNADIVRCDAIDFQRYFADYGADRVDLTTALRMNATYPIILPNAYLPTEPMLEIMDAGFRDNYGTTTSARFLQLYKDWILENTSGVVLVQVVGWERDAAIADFDSQGAFEALLNPFGMLGRVSSNQMYEHDTYLSYLYELLGEDMLHVARFVYRPSEDNERATMNFRLTEQEYRDVLNAIYLPDNQESLRKVTGWLGE